MSCNICGHSVHKVFEAKIMNRYQISYYFCDSCHFLQTEEPYWLEEAYQDAINCSDTGILTRNLDLSKQAAAIIFCLFDKQRIFLDYAGGYGILTRLMRDLGFDYYWFDLYAKNIFAQGFDYHPGIGEIELVTSFESFEHFPKPIEEIEKMLDFSKNILFSTELLPSPVPQSGGWWYYGLDHGQHISFYSKNTLKYIAKKYRLQLYTQYSLHLLTDKKINPLFFRFILRMSRLGLHKFISRSLRSKTFGDMQLIKERCIRDMLDCNH